MKRTILVFVSAFLLLAGTAASEVGGGVFDAQKCGICHKPETGQTTPSLKEIALAYQGKEDRLLSYFKGEAEPIIRPEKASLMKRPIEKTKALSDDDRKALAAFILTHAK